MREKLFIYQMMPRLFSNRNGTNRHNGSLAENGCGKFNDLSHSLLRNLRIDGYTHIWYIGIPAHASATDYTAYGIPKQFPEIIKGKAGSPYAIETITMWIPTWQKMYPDGWRSLSSVDRTHQAGLKVITDFVPNHVARNYCSVAKPSGFKDFGDDDNDSVAFTSKQFLLSTRRVTEDTTPHGETSELVTRSRPHVPPVMIASPICQPPTTGMRR